MRRAAHRTSTFAYSFAFLERERRFALAAVLLLLTPHEGRIARVDIVRAPAKLGQWAPG